MQLDQDAGGFGRGRLAPDVVARQVLEAELARRAAFPEERHVEPFGEALRLGEHLRPRRPIEGQEHVGRLDLRAAPVGALDLEGARRLGKHRAHFQVAVLLIEKLHGRTR
ncbi:hypothetical protein D3C83_27220 [compost metagenome]